MDKNVTVELDEFSDAIMQMISEFIEEASEELIDQPTQCDESQEG